MNINETVKQVHQNAVEKGWHETERSPLEYHMLFVSEVAEATEQVRMGAPHPIYQNGATDPGLRTPDMEGFVWNRQLKPEGEAIELCDVIIRIMDYFGQKGWDLEQAIRLKMEYNALRSYRHGGKKY